MTDQFQTKVKSVQQRDPAGKQRLRTFKVMQLIWLALSILEALLGLRVIFKLIAVNPANSLASFLYRLTDLVLRPFAGLTATPSAGDMVLEISTLIAMIIYALLGWGLVKLVEVIFYRPRERVVNVTESTSVERHTGR